MTQSVAIRARWILPLDSPPIRDGMLVMQAGRITELGLATPGRRYAMDWENAAILPSLVNAHTHLEFSSLETPLGSPGTALTDWIPQVIAWRRERDRLADTSGVPTENRLGEALRRGLRECLATGTATVGEIATYPASQSTWRASQVGGTEFHELIGLSRARIESQLAVARQHIATSPATPNLTLGLSPHAPYTVHPALLSAVADFSRAARFPLAMHVAESEAERQLLQTGRGPFVDLLQSLQAWDPAAIPHGSRPLDYLRLLATAHSALVVHGNYLDDEEMSFLGQHRDRMSLVYCPRTHNYFGHRPYPMDKLLGLGVRVVLGTDSRASNPNLNLWEEMRFAASRHQTIAPHVWVRAVTVEAARALGVDRRVGGLSVGKMANLLVVQLPAGRDRDLWDGLLDPGSQLRAVYLHGRPMTNT